MLMPSFLSDTREAISTPPGSGRSAQPIAKASLWNAKPRGELVADAPLTKIVLDAVGEAEAFWNGPDVTIPSPPGPAIGIVAVPPPAEATFAVTTQFASTPVD